MATTVQSRRRTAASPPLAGIILRDVSWTTYESLLADQIDRRLPRFAYDQGTLEIVVTLSAEHERASRRLASLVEIVTEELAIDLDNVGSTTFKRQDAQRGFEADTAFYLQHAADVRQRSEIDPAVDPPPDLVIEIDVSSHALDKFPIYAAMGVPEIWRYKQGRVTVHLLRFGRYEAALRSAALPPLTTDILNHFLAEGRSLSRLAWLRAVREWARQQIAAAPGQS